MSIDINTLAGQIAETEDITYRTAFNGLELYISQVEEIDGREIDTDAISDEDAEFLVAAFHAEQRAGDFGRNELFTLAECVQDVDTARDDMQHKIQQRDRAIRAALAEGAKIGEVADLTGLDRESITQIAD